MKKKCRFFKTFVLLQVMKMNKNQKKLEKNKVAQEAENEGIV